VNNTTPAVYGCDWNANSVFNEGADGQNNACAMFTVRRAIAYLDCTGLRPMTEMEYEKVCRGTKFNGQPNPRVIGEYPWGTTELNIYNTANLSYIGSDTERVTAAVVNGRIMIYSQNPNHFPARVGQVAWTGTGRASSGAGFYGNMDLAGNGWELVLGVNNSSNPATTTALGNGNLNMAAGPTSGDADVAAWSDYSTPTYWGLRGGSWWEITGYNTNSQTSNRNQIPLTASILQTTTDQCWRAGGR
jgi:hypothetical protein